MKTQVGFSHVTRAEFCESDLPVRASIRAKQEPKQSEFNYASVTMCGFDSEIVIFVTVYWSDQ